MDDNYNFCVGDEVDGRTDAGKRIRAIVLEVLPNNNYRVKNFDKEILVVSGNDLNG